MEIILNFTKIVIIIAILIVRALMPSALTYDKAR